MELNMEFVLLFMIVWCLGAGLYFWFLYRNPIAWQRPLFLGTLMSRHEVGFEHIIKLGLEEEYKMRARSCFACREISECQNRLRGKCSVRYRDICSSAEFLDRLRH